MTRLSLIEALPHLYARQSPARAALPWIRRWVSRAVVPHAERLMDQMGFGLAWSMPLPDLMPPQRAGMPAVGFTRLWVVRADRPDGRESFYLTVGPIPEPSR